MKRDINEQGADKVAERIQQEASMLNQEMQKQNGVQVSESQPEIKYDTDKPDVKVQIRAPKPKRAKSPTMSMAGGPNEEPKQVDIWDMDQYEPINRPGRKKRLEKAKLQQSQTDK